MRTLPAPLKPTVLECGIRSAERMMSRQHKERRRIVNAREFRALAHRCRELQRVAVRDDIREQLRQWAIDFEAEAETVEKARDYSAALGDGK
jgi:hypothetical protein